MYKRVNTALKRDPDEPVEAFYARFAQLYQELIAETPSPNAYIAKVSGLSTNLIKQYVYRARVLGYLPPSRKNNS
jgi:hypothetical protein